MGRELLNAGKYDFSVHGWVIWEATALCEATFSFLISRCFLSTINKLKQTASNESLINELNC